MKKSGSDRLFAARSPASANDVESERPTLIQPPAALSEEAAPITSEGRPSFDDELELELDSFAASEGHATLDERLSAEPPGDDPAYVGQILDNRYVVEEVIARGGMGVVYRCRHRLIGKQFAVKIIRSDMAQLPDAPRRFLMEATAASAIGNEHIIDIFDYGSLADGASFLVMELLTGETLAQVIKSHRPLSPARILSIATQVCEGLRAAHQAGIVHRDLKPENIVLISRQGRDFVKILDFGIAKMSGGAAPLTQRGLIVGTPHYMAPEQASGDGVDERGDIYSLGVILYELTTGQVPFDASHYMAVLGKHMSEPPPPLPRSCFPSSVATAFEAVVLRCLAKRPEDRFQSMAEVAAALEQLGRHLTQPLPALDTPSHPGIAPAPPERRSLLSVPAAAARSLLPGAARRGAGLLLSATVLAIVLVASVWRLGSDDERGASAARAPATRHAGSARERSGALPAGVGAPSSSAAPSMDAPDAAVPEPSGTSAPARASSGAGPER